MEAPRYRSLALADVAVAQRVGRLALGALGALEGELGGHRGVGGAAGGLVARDDVDRDRDRRQLALHRLDVDPAELELADLGEAELAERRDVDLEQDPARLARVEVAELGHEAALGRGHRKVVEEAHRGDLVARAHGEARGLDRLGHQALDLRGQRRAGVVAVLGEAGVAAASSRDRGQQVLVVAEADADRRGRDPAPLGAGREALELLVVGDALVGVAVGEQDQGGAAAVGGALGLLDSAQQPAGEVGHAARVDGGKRLAGPGAVADGAGRDRDRDLVVEGHEAEAVLGAKPADQGVERLKRREEAPVGHRAAAVDHHLERGRRAVLDVVRGWGGELEEGVDGVLVLDRDQVVLELEFGSHED